MYVLKVLGYVPILCCGEAAKHISKINLLYNLNTNGTVTNYDKFTHSLLNHNIVTSSLVSINRYLVVSRTP